MKSVGGTFTDYATVWFCLQREDLDLSRELEAGFGPNSLGIVAVSGVCNFCPSPKLSLFPWLLPVYSYSDFLSGMLTKVLHRLTRCSFLQVPKYSELRLKLLPLASR